MNVMETLMDVVKGVITKEEDFNVSVGKDMHFMQTIKLVLVCLLK